MAMLAAVRSISLLHRWWLGTSSGVALVHLLSMEVLCMAGAVANVLRFPERYIHALQPAQGLRKAQRLDLWGNSHQIMHALVTVGMFNVYWAVSAESQHILTVPCPT